MIIGHALDQTDTAAFRSNRIRPDVVPENKSIPSPSSRTKYNDGENQHGISFFMWTDKHVQFPSTDYMWAEVNDVTDPATLFAYEDCAKCQSAKWLTFLAWCSVALRPSTASVNQWKRQENHQWRPWKIPIVPNTFQPIRTKMMEERERGRGRGRHTRNHFHSSDFEWMVRVLVMSMRL